MIFLITASARGEECAVALERATGERVSVVPTLRGGNFGSTNSSGLADGARAIVIDEAFIDLRPGVEDELLALAGEAPPIFVNMAISGISRIVQNVRQALQRHDRQQLSAMLAAESMLRSELNGALTGILLNSQLALQTPALPEGAAAKMRDVYGLAVDLKARLQHREQPSARKRSHAAVAAKSY